MKFTELDGKKVEAVFTTPIDPKKSLGISLIFKSEDKYLHFDPENTAYEGASGVNFTQLHLRVLSEEEFKKLKVNQLLTLDSDVMSSIASILPKQTETLSFMQLTSMAWFSNKFMSCTNILGFKLGKYVVEFYSRRHTMNPFAVVDWIIYSKDENSTSAYEVIVDNTVNRVIGVVKNDFYSSDDVLGMVLTEQNYGHVRLHLSDEVCTHLITDGRKDYTFRRIQLTHHFVLLTE